MIYQLPRNTSRGLDVYLSLLFYTTNNATLAQSVEHVHGKDEVKSSNLLGSSIHADSPWRVDSNTDTSMASVSYSNQ